MKTYKISLFESTGGYATIEAESLGHARKLAKALLDRHGLAGFPDFTATNREFNLIDVEEND